MENPPDAAMVLAAGLGTRMRPLTDERPKPLIDVGGKPLIDYALDRFGAAGVTRAVVNVHYKPEMIRAHLIARLGAPSIIVSDETEHLLETGGGLKKAAPLLGAGPVYCTNTDAILVDEGGQEACARLARVFDPAKMDALLLVAPIGLVSGYEGRGDFHLATDGRLDWRDRAGGDADTAPFVFTGLQIISLGLLDDAPDGAFSTKTLWDKAHAMGRLYGLIHRGRWMHVGDPQGLAEAERWFAENAQRKVG